MRKFLLLPAILELFVFSGLAQQPSATPPEDQVVRISTNLIQIFCSSQFSIARETNRH